MKKILFSLLIFMISCQNNDLESKKKRLDNLKNSLVETYSEIEKLEKEINTKKKESEKNIQLITEMANAELDDVELFLSNSRKLIDETMDLAKNDKNFPPEAKKCILTCFYEK